MAGYAEDSYNDPGKETIPRIDPEKLSPEARNILDNPKTGFSAAVYQPDENRIVIAYRGTEMTSAQDWWTNGKQALGYETNQYDQAKQLAQSIQEQYPDKTIELTGHSLGGGLAAAASAATGLPATTFNAAGVNPNTIADYNTPEPGSITNYRVQGEIVTGLQETRIATPEIKADLPLIGKIDIPSYGVQAPTALGTQETLPLPPPDPNRGWVERAKEVVLSPLAPIDKHLMTSVNSSLDYAIQQEKAKP